MSLSTMILWFIIRIAIIVSIPVFIVLIISRIPHAKVKEEEVLDLLHQYAQRCQTHKDTNNNDHTESSKERDTNDKPLSGIQILITGPTSGIGLLLTKQLYRSGATIIGVARSSKRLESLKLELETEEEKKSPKKTGMAQQKTRFFMYTADFTDLDTVRSACKLIQSDFSESCIDFLINNAGVANVFDENGDFLHTKQGYELVFGVNYLSHYLLTTLLMPLIEKSSNFPRIISMSSNLHRGVTGDTLLRPKLSQNALTDTSSSYPISSGKNVTAPTRMHSYANSKFAQVLHVRTLNRNQAERLESQSTKPIPVNNIVHSLAICPGAVRTDIHGEKFTSFIRSFFFPVEISIICILNAMFTPISPPKTKFTVDYVKSIPTLPIMKPFMCLPEKQRFNYLFVMAIITMPLQKLIFTHSFYSERSDERTYEKFRQDDLELWTRKELEKWLQ